MDKKDILKNAWERNRGRAIEFGKQWAEEMMKDYREPSRAGTPKGDPIGFSREKQKAAYLMILYSPSALNLKGIASETRIKENVLRVWRTQENFQKAECEACELLGEHISNTIDLILTKEEIEFIKQMRLKDGDNYLTLYPSGDKKILRILKSDRQNPSPLLKKFLAKEVKKRNIIVDEIDDLQTFATIPYLGIGLNDPEKIKDFWLELLPFFNSLVCIPLIKLAKQRIDLYWGGYIGFMGLLLKYSQVKDEKSLKKWNHQPAIKDLTKTLIEKEIDWISKPEEREFLGQEKIDKMAQDLKNMIFRELNLLES